MNILYFYKVAFIYCPQCQQRHDYDINDVVNDPPPGVGSVVACIKCEYDFRIEGEAVA